MANTFLKKGYGRIYVLTPNRVSDVICVINGLDAFEAEYLRSDFVVSWDGSVELVPIGKFEIDIDLLTLACLHEGIHIWCLSYQHETAGVDLATRFRAYSEVELEVRA